MPQPTSVAQSPRRYGVLLVNLGSPAAPDAAAVRRFLRPFLGDRRVVEIPRPLWWPLLNLFILPFRAPRVARLYQRIWMAEGAPLQVHLERLREAVTARFHAGSSGGDRIEVRAAVTYGAPAIADQLDALMAAGSDEVIVIPLYPQYSATTTAAVFDAVSRWMQQRRDLPGLTLVKDYHDHPRYIEALAQSVRTAQQQFGTPERLLFSFHGIPQANVDQGDPYARHCHRTAEAVAQALGLELGQWLVAFQSRFGPAQWLQPYMDEAVKALAAEGVRHLQVISPSFSLDCLETLDEIDHEYRQLFLSQGGERFHYVPALNAGDSQVELLVELISCHLPAAR